MKTKETIKKIYDPSEAVLRRLCLREKIEKKDDIRMKVMQIMENVRKNGDRALRKLSLKYDNVEISEFRIPKIKIKRSGNYISISLKKAIQTAFSNIRKFHKYNNVEPNDPVYTMPGVECFIRFIPVERVGLYIPGGNNPLFSSLLMTAIPAKIAGCDEIAVFTPPTKSGTPDPRILYCADLLGINEIYSIGGAQAVAAMVYGTETVKKVEKIFGPGNSYVNEAKLQAAGFGTAIDMPAGPSELMIIADGTSDPDYIVSDFFSQLEHGPGSFTILISRNTGLIETVNEKINFILKNIAPGSYIRQNLERCILIFTEDKKKIENFINNFAPEHLLLSMRNSRDWIPRIRNAGSVFLGNYSAESIGDYASGTNHTLPTGSAAKSFSGLSVSSFKKSMTFQKISKTGLKNIGRTVIKMAEEEGMKFHAEAVKVRLSKNEYNDNKIPDPADLILTRFKEITPYKSARMENPTGKIFLDANESPYEIIGNSSVSRYPDPNHSALRNELAKELNISEKMIFTGNGSDELIDLLIRIFCREGSDNIIVHPPTYGMYSKFAELNGVPVLRVNLLPGFKLDTDDILKKSRENSVKLIFINSPNNPTGNSFPREEILKIAESSGAVTVVDEAYIDFSKNESLIGMTEKIPGLLVLRTLSKSFSAAGLRIGVLVGNKKIISTINTVRAPYNIGNISQKLAIELIKNKQKRAESVASIISEREFLIHRLTGMKQVEKIFPSDANFLLVKFIKKERILNLLRDYGIIVRDRSMLHQCHDCLRITVGSPSENRKLLKILKNPVIRRLK